MRLLAGWNGVPLVGIGHTTIEGADPCLKAPKYPEFRCQVAGGYAQQDMFGIWVSDQDCKEKRVKSGSLVTTQVSSQKSRCLLVGAFWTFFAISLNVIIM